ncbi:MAG: hypothetical protein CVV31_13570 [Methanomicrobiales archaeon HGW-Methanomicrobiales-2]|nr:MAG: hypothetical protein CVV31_13570 [Methanomicrobiales archaeon HGW-Methanomicrobiales-2]
MVVPAIGVLTDDTYPYLASMFFIDADKPRKSHFVPIYEFIGYIRAVFRDIVAHTVKPAYEVDTVHCVVWVVFEFAWELDCMAAVQEYPLCIIISPFAIAEINIITWQAIEQDTLIPTMTGKIDNIGSVNIGLIHAGVCPTIGVSVLITYEETFSPSRI